MIKSRVVLSILLILALSFSVFAGCSPKKVVDTGTSSPQPSSSNPNSSTDTFNYSDGIDENGLWANIKALDYVEIKDYKGILIPADIHTITDESVKTEVDSILTDYATKNQVTNRTVKDGDTVNIDYVGSIDGVEFEGGNTNGAGTEVTIGVTNYIDDFLQQIIGHTPGESFNVEVTFPEDYGVEELNGKDAIFAVKLNHIIETIAPVLSDEFIAEKLSTDYGWKTIAEMEAEIREDMQKSALSNYIQNYITENSTVKSIPESVLKYQENMMIQYFKSNAESYNMDLDTFLSSYVGVKNTEELLELYLEDSKQSAEQSLIMQAIAEDANITVADKDVAAYFKEYVGTEDYSVYKDSYGMPYLKMVILNQSVMDYLQNNVVLE